MKRLIQWLRGRWAVRLASIAFAQKYPDRRPVTGTLYGADQSGTSCSYNLRMAIAAVGPQLVAR